MTLFHKHRLTFDLNYKTRTFFFEKAKKNKDQTVVAERVRAAFDKLDGVIQSLTSAESKITVEWNEDLNAPFLGRIAALLTEGNYTDGILLLEFFRSESPDDPDILYNLGMAYSDQNQLPQAVEILAQVVKTRPDHVNGRVALGVAYLRSKQIEAGVKELQTAVEQEPENPGAQRNLGVGLAQLKRHAEAAEHFRKAAELAPQDQQAWYGYAKALEEMGNDDADEAYKRAITADEYSQIAEFAKEARSRIARKNFRNAMPGAPRMDAVMYCLGALEKFENMSLDQIQKIGFEIAMLGTRGIDVNNPDTRYTLKNLPGDFSGLHLLSIQYVAFKKFAPDQDIGFDLSAEYQAALKLFGK
jgi:Flp pilus assembly protein TadD